jgi:methionyl-tRNA formyltransferase
MAPVPEYRGCNQFSFAVLDGATTFGTTLHELNAGIDAGDVLFEDRFEISPTITAKELHTLTEQKSIVLFEQNIGNFLSGNYTPISQAELAKTRPQGFY